MLELRGEVARPSRAFSKEAARIVEKAKADIRRLIKNQQGPVFKDDYCLCRMYKYGDASGRITDPFDVIYDLLTAPKRSRRSFVVATPEVVEKTRVQIAEDEVEKLARAAMQAREDLVNSETKIRKTVADGKISKKKAESIIKKVRGLK